MSGDHRAARGISGFTAVCLVIANMVGTGVFTSLGFQVADIRSGFVLMGLWALGGLLAWCGAVCYAELAGAIPRSGGEMTFLARTLHPALGFMAGWVSATVGFAAPIALSAMAFGKYLDAALGGGVAYPVWTGLGLVGAVAAVQMAGMRAGEWFQAAFTVGKVALILVFIGAAWARPGAGDTVFAPGAGDGALWLSGPFVVSLVFVMYAYSGWNAATYLMEDVRDAARVVPRALVIGTLIVALLYLGLNHAFLRAAPAAALAGKVEAGFVAGEAVFGEAGGRLVAGVIALVLVSSVSAMLWAGSRLLAAMGERVAVLGWFAGRKGGVPRRAIGAVAVAAAALAATATFESVVAWLGFALTACSVLTVAGMAWLRVREPGLARPFRVWGHPLPALAYGAIGLWTLVYLAREKPLESAAAAGILGLGLAIFWASKGRVWKREKEAEA